MSTLLKILGTCDIQGLHVYLNMHLQIDPLFHVQPSIFGECLFINFSGILASILVSGCGGFFYIYILYRICENISRFKC